MEFRELSDCEWQFIRLLPPPRARTSRPRLDDRMVVIRYSIRVFYWLPLDGYAC